jgi:hypothetical protein
VFHLGSIVIHTRKERIAKSLSFLVLREVDRKEHNSSRYTGHPVPVVGVDEVLWMDVKRTALDTVNVVKRDLTNRCGLGGYPSPKRLSHPRPARVSNVLRCPVSASLRKERRAFVEIVICWVISNCSVLHVRVGKSGCQQHQRSRKRAGKRFGSVRNPLSRSSHRVVSILTCETLTAAIPNR